MRRVAALLAILLAGTAALFVLLGDEPRSGLSDLPRPAGVEPSLAADGFDAASTSEERAAIEADPDERAAVETAEEEFSDPSVAAESESPGAVLLARVIDERRRPVAGASVEFLDLDGPRLSERSDAEGRVRFSIPCGTESRVVLASVLATDGVDRAAVEAMYFLMPAPGMPEVDSKDLGDLVLEPAGPVRVQVRENGVPVAGARVSLDVGFHRLPCGLETTDETGVAHFPLVPHGTTVATATSATSTGSARASEREGDRVLAIDLARGRIVELRVIERATGLPVEGVRVGFEALALPPVSMSRAGDPVHVEMRPVGGRSTRTDADGRALVENLPRDVELWAFVEGDDLVESSRPPEPSPSCVLVPSEDRSELVLEIERLSAHEVVVPVVPGELPVPPDGTLVHLRSRSDSEWMDEHVPAVARIEGSAIRIEDVLALSLDLLAETEDHAIARIRVRDETPETGEPTSFVRARSVRVYVQDGEGTPVVEASVAAQSNTGGRALGEWAETDALGLAVLGGLLPGRVQIAARHPGEDEDRGLPVATVDVEDGDREITVELPRRAVVDLRFWIDGEPRLPAKLIAFGAKIERELPDEGRMLLSKASDPVTGQVKLDLLADGFVRMVLELTAADLERSEPIDVHLVAEAAILVRVVRQENARVRLAAERWNDTQASWRETQGWHDLRYPNAEDGLFLFDELEPGLVRIRDAESGLQSDPIELLAGDRVDLVLDLLSTDVVRGRIVGPEADLSLARVLVFGEDVERLADSWNATPGIPRNAFRTERGKGRFELRIPTDGTVELRAWHPWLRPHPEAGHAIVRSSTEEIELHLAGGPSARFALPAEIRGWRAGLHVLLFPVELDGPPISEAYAALWGDGARFGGYEPGRYTLWIDPQKSYAPAILRDVELGEGTTDLGAPVFTAGSSVRLHVTPPTGQEIPRVYLYAMAAEPPRYRRGTTSNGEAEIVLSGLAKATWHVRAQSTSGQRRVLLEEEVLLDGEHDELFEIDLR